MRGRKQSRVNEAGNYTKPGLRERLFEGIKGRETHGTKAGQWSARKAQLATQKYKTSGGGYTGPKTEAQKSLFRKLGALTGSPGAGTPAWLMSHPSTEDRIRAIEAREARWVQT